MSNTSGTSNARFDKALVICPVYRLGSLLDASPFIDGVLTHFGNRAIISASRECQSLLRYRFEQGIAEGATVYPTLAHEMRNFQYERRFAFAHLYSLSKQQVADIRSDCEAIKESVSADSLVAMPIYDDPILIQDSVHYYFDYLHVGLRRKPFVIGMDKALRYFEQTFDHVIKMSDTQNPYFLNSLLEMLRVATHGRYAIPDNRRKPMIWTSEREAIEADKFFCEQGLDPSKTIGVHLGAMANPVFYDPSLAEINGKLEVLKKNGWGSENIHKVFGHFANNGFRILVCDGYFANALDYRSYYGDGSKDLRSALQHPFIENYEHSSFFGDVLVQAEVIRKCAAFLSAETGPAHLASAVGTPKVTIAKNQYLADLYLHNGPHDTYFSLDTNAPSAGAVIEGLERAIAAKSAP